MPSFLSQGTGINVAKVTQPSVAFLIIYLIPAQRAVFGGITFAAKELLKPAQIRSSRLKIHYLLPNQTLIHGVWFGIELILSQVFEISYVKLNTTYLSCEKGWRRTEPLWNQYDLRSENFSFAGYEEFAFQHAFKSSVSRIGFPFLLSFLLINRVRTK